LALYDVRRRDIRPLLIVRPVTLDACARGGADAGAGATIFGMDRPAASAARVGRPSGRRGSRTLRGWAAPSWAPRIVPKAPGTQEAVVTDDIEHAAGEPDDEREDASEPLAPPPAIEPGGGPMLPPSDPPSRGIVGP